MIGTHVSTDNMPGMVCVSLLDLLLVFLTAACVAWAFNVRAALIWVIFFGCHYLISTHYTLRAAFLRLDWVMCLALAVCFLKKGWYGLAGGLTAYAALARVFPVAFAFGMGVKMLADVIKTRKLGRNYLAYWASFTGAMVMLVGASIIYSGGIESWKEFLSKILQHDRDISGWRIGFKYVFLMSYNGGAFWGQDLGQFFEHWKVVWWAIQLIVIAASAFLIRYLDDYEALAYGRCTFRSNSSSSVISSHSRALNPSRGVHGWRRMASKRRWLFSNPRCSASTFSSSVKLLSR